MKHLHIYILLLAAVLTGCSKDDMPESGQTSRTVLVYMMAENSLAKLSYNDINEMIAGSAKITDTNRLLVYIDNANIQGDSLPVLMRIHDQKADTLKIYPEQDSCDGEVFASVLNDAKSLSSTDSYSLVMWSHGTGWLPARNTPKKTIGLDNGKNNLSNNGSEMEVTAMREAIEQSGLHQDWILFDACFMQCIETAYELKDITDYIIGSPAEIPGNGAPYEKVVPYFYIENNEQSAKAIAYEYYDYYKDYQGALLSVVKTSELEALANSTAACFTTVPTVDDAEGIQQYCPWAEISCWQTEYYDMASLMYHKAGTSEFLQWRDAMEKAIPVRLQSSHWQTEYGFYFDATMTDNLHYAGASMFLPAERYEGHGYNDAIKNTRWWQKVFTGRE